MDLSPLVKLTNDALEERRTQIYNQPWDSSTRQWPSKGEDTEAFDGVKKM